MIKPTLGGSTFVYNGISQDYNFIETLNCLYDLCDEISIAFGGTDGTIDSIYKWADNHHLKPVTLNNFSDKEWEEQKGRQKLSYFSNMAIACLDTDWNFYLQADEIIHERSFSAIRDAIIFDIDSYVCKRWNLWKDPLHHLEVEQERKPCSTEVIRLAKTKYRCFDDAESVMAPFTHVYGVPEAIEIFHMGFIRDPVKHVVKAKNMLVDIFGLGMDDRIGEKFDPDKFPFTGNDIQPIKGPLPKYIKDWCIERYPDLKDRI